MIAMNISSCSSVRICFTLQANLGVGISSVGFHGISPACFAASSDSSGNLCVVRSERYLLEKRGFPETEERLVEIAMAHHWYDREKGTPLKFVGKLLEYFGLEVERRFCGGMEDLLAKLKAGCGIIACVDGGELTGDIEQEKYEDRWIGEIPDYVVVIRGIDVEERIPRVVLYDAAEDNHERICSLERFIDSWKDSKYYMISIK